jgi:CheY-like chemotaxis protein
MGSLKGPIIILEDDPDEKELLEEAIRPLSNNEIKFFSTGDAMLKYLEETKDRPFVILSDVNVPGLTGLQLKKKINETPFLRRKSIPFVFLSTTANQKSVEAAYDLNSQGFFIKQDSLKEIQRHLSLIFGYWSECRHTNSDS